MSHLTYLRCLPQNEINHALEAPVLLQLKQESRQPAHEFNLSVFLGAHLLRIVGSNEPSSNFVSPALAELYFGPCCVMTANDEQCDLMTARAAVVS